jgi:hypothetical protein
MQEVIKDFYKTLDFPVTKMPKGDILPVPSE